MPKRSRDDSSSSSSRSPTPDPSSPASIATPSHSSKYLHTSGDVTYKAVMKCSLPPHAEPLSFSTYEEFEIHYAKIHAHRCSDCRRNFPTEHFLELHIGENHDPLNEARKAKGEKTYRCFLEDCDKVCSTPQKRRMHLTDKHMFPKNYDFHVVNTGIDKRSSMLRTRHRKTSSAASRAFHRGQHSNGVDAISENVASSSDPNEPSAKDIENTGNMVSTQPPSSDPDVDELVSTMSSLKFVPPSVRFGRGGRRGGLSRS